MPLSKDFKAQVIADFHTNEKDTGSSEVQVALLTKRILQLTEHLKKHKGDESSRRGLLKMVGERRRHLMYISKHEPKKFDALVAKLGLRRR